MFRVKRRLAKAARWAYSSLLKAERTDYEQKIYEMFPTPAYCDPWLEVRRGVLDRCEKIIQKTVPLMPHSHRKLLQNIARNAVRHCWPFAASEDHHHHKMGGLAIHSCETMYAALKLYNDRFTPETIAREIATKGDRISYMTANKHFERAGFALALAALAHDLGKMFDQTIATGRPGLNFMAFSEMPEVWLAMNNVNLEKAHIHWHAERERDRHAIASVGILLYLLTPYMGDKEMGTTIAQFMSERAFDYDRNAPEIPLKNFPKIATYLHMANTAILYHNNMAYKGTDNFILHLLRQADVDSVDEWRAKEAISFVDFVREFFRDQYGDVIRGNAPGALTIYVRKASRFILIPKKRFYQLFKEYIATYGKKLSANEEQFAIELVRQGVAVSVDAEKKPFEPLIYTIRAPSIVPDPVNCLVINTDQLGLTFDTQYPDIPIFFLGSNRKDKGTGNLFYFTKIMRSDDERALNEESSKKAMQVLKDRKDEKVDEEEVVDEGDSTEEIEHEKGYVAEEHDRQIETKGDEGEEDEEDKDVPEMVESLDDKKEAHGVDEDADNWERIKDEEFELVDAGSGGDTEGHEGNAVAEYINAFDPENRTIIIEMLAQLVGTLRFKVNDPSLQFTLLLPQNDNRCFVKLKDLPMTIPEYADCIAAEIKHVVETQLAGKKDIFGRKIGLFKMETKGKSKMSGSDYMMCFPRWKGLQQPKGGLRLDITHAKDPASADEVLSYCGLK